MRGLFWFLFGAVAGPGFVAALADADDHVRKGVWSPTGDLRTPLSAPVAVPLSGGDVLALGSREQEPPAQRW